MQLRARWNGRSSKQDLSGLSKRLTDDQELALCLYLRRLDTIGTSVRFPMVTSCANSILRWSHDSAVAASDPTTYGQLTLDITVSRAPSRVLYTITKSTRAITTLHTVRSLKRHADAVIAEIFERAAPESPTGNGMFVLNSSRKWPRNMYPCPHPCRFAFKFAPTYR
jgi:hypothetical protein